MSDGVGKLYTIRYSPIKSIYQCTLWFHIETVPIAEPIGAMINSSYVKQSACSRLELWTLTSSHSGNKNPWCTLSVVLVLWIGSAVS